MRLLDILYEIRTLKSSRSTIYGLRHNNASDIKKVLDDINKNFSINDKIVFMGEGGDSNNIYPPNSEGEIIYSILKKQFKNIINDSWDGKEFDVANPNAFVFRVIQSSTGLSKQKTLAAIYAAMVGQDVDPSEVSRLITPEGLKWLSTFDIKNPVNPDAEDKQLMYDLSFPQDTGQPEQEISLAVTSYNKERDKNLIRKLKKYESQGYRVIALVGKDHIDLIGSI